MSIDLNSKVQISVTQAEIKAVRAAFPGEWKPLACEDGTIEYVCSRDYDIDGYDWPPPHDRYEDVHLISYADCITLQAFEDGDEYVVILAPNVATLVGCVNWREMSVKRKRGATMWRATVG